MRLARGGETRDVRLEGETATIDGRRICLRPLWRGNRLVGVEIDGAPVRVRVATQKEKVFVWLAGMVFEVHQALRSSRAGEHGGDLLAPMPGRVQKTLVTRGESVSRGQVVLILEAMKMEHAIRAPRDGVVTRLAHEEGDLVEAGAALAEIT